MFGLGFSFALEGQEGRRFMPRKALDMRKTCGRLFAKGKKKAPQGRDTWRIAINTARLRGSCQEHRGINSRAVMIHT